MLSLIDKSTSAVTPEDTGTLHSLAPAANAATEDNSGEDRTVPSLDTVVNLSDYRGGRGFTDTAEQHSMIVIIASGLPDAHCKTNTVDICTRVGFFAPSVLVCKAQVVEDVDLIVREKSGDHDGDSTSYRIGSTSNSITDSASRPLTAQAALTLTAAQALLRRVIPPSMR